MALGATVHRLIIGLSDADRGVYAELDLRVARHPSESLRYLVSRVFAYCLEHEEGIAWSRGGLSQTDEPPVLIRDATGVLEAWIDVGTPSGERLHRAAKAAERVVVYSAVELAAVQRGASDKPARAIHRAAEIGLVLLPSALVTRVGERLEKTTELGVVRSGGSLYVTIAGETLEGSLATPPLFAPGA